MAVVARAALLLLAAPRGAAAALAPRRRAADAAVEAGVAAPPAWAVDSFGDKVVREEDGALSAVAHDHVASTERELSIASIKIIAANLKAVADYIAGVTVEVTIEIDVDIDVNLSINSSGDIEVDIDGEVQVDVNIKVETPDGEELLDCPSGSPCHIQDDPGGHNDPHLYTWKGVMYDYHGQCDLIYTTCPRFDNDKGLHVHLRTKFVMPDEWSTITNLAVKIGDDTFELQEDGTYYVNHQKNPAISDTANLAGHKLKRKHLTKPKGNDFTIALGDDISLEVSNRQWKGKHSLEASDREAKDHNNMFFKIVGVHGHRNDGGSSLSDCIGLTSTWDHPNDDMFLVGRSGATYSKGNTIDFGPEWQVDRAKGDPMLFAEDAGQQLPKQKCIDSHFDVQDKRHLKALYTEDGGALARRAEEACRHLNRGKKDLFEACVFDVLVTGDVSFAEEPWYNGGDEL